MPRTNPVGDSNVKLGGLWSTYNPIGGDADGTCPPTCPALGAGCYGQQGNCNLHQGAASATLSARLGAVRRAARETARKGLPAFRLHVTGDWHRAGVVDWRYVAGVRAILRAYGVRAWCYTHEPSHAVVAKLRAALGPWCVVWHSDHAGAGGAVVVREHATAPRVKGRLPCKSQTGDDTCRTCGWCFDPRLVDVVTIQFEAHGPGKRRLPVLR